MKKIQEVLKNKSGQGVPMILAVVLCCLILACVTFEYMRLMIVAQGVRDSVQSAIVDVATENWDEAYAINKNSPNIVYRFHNEIIEITLEDYLKENPDKTEHDFAELKALSDQIYYEQDRAESAQTRKDVSIHGLEETEHCATRALDEEWEERVVDIQNRKYAWKALEQLFTVGALTEVQKRRFRLHVFQGLSTRQIGRMEGTSHQAVAKSINLAIAKLKKYFAAQG